MKGFIPDITEIFAILFGVAILCFVAWSIFGGFLDSDAFANDTAIIRGQGMIESISTFSIILLVGLVVFVVYSASMVDVHPALLPVSIVMLIVSCIFLMGIGDAWYEFSRSDVMIDATNSLTVLVYIMDNILEIGIIIGFVVLIALYSKRKTIFGGATDGY